MMGVDSAIGNPERAKLVMQAKLFPTSITSVRQKARD
jgi:hypothetical protein